MNKKINAVNESMARKGGNFRRIKEFTPKEFLIGYALTIGTADCSEKGENLWAKSKANREWKGHWKSVSVPTDFGIYMRLYRYKQFKRFLPMIWETNDVRTKNDNPWWKFNKAIESFNKIRHKLLTPSEIMAIDESMSAYRPQTTKTGGLPHISYILRKPEDLGTEFKSTGKCNK